MDPDIINYKKNIREQIAKEKKKLTPGQIETRSHILSQKLFSLPQYQNADTVFVYMSFNQEVLTAEIIERALADGKKVAVPKVFTKDENGNILPLNERKIEFIYIDSNTVYSENKGILEPIGGQVADSDALVIVPGLAFGSDLNRIGYGGGFYDRYFSAHKDRSFCKVAICFDFQVFDSLDVDEHDEKIDILISG